MGRDGRAGVRLLALAGWCTLAPALVLLGMRLAPSQSWVPAAQMVGLLPVAAPLAVGALLLLLAPRQRSGVVTATVVVAVLMGLLAPRLVDSTLSPVAGDEPLRLGAVNTYFGRADADRLATLVEDYRLDLVCIAEATPEFEKDLHAAGLTAYLPEVVSAAEGGASGTILYSRLPLRELQEVAGTSFRMPRAVVSASAGVEVTDLCAPPAASAGRSRRLGERAPADPRCRGGHGRPPDRPRRLQRDLGPPAGARHRCGR